MSLVPATLEENDEREHNSNQNAWLAGCRLNCWIEANFNVGKVHFLHVATTTKIHCAVGDFKFAKYVFKLQKKVQ